MLQFDDTSKLYKVTLQADSTSLHYKLFLQNKATSWGYKWQMFESNSKGSVKLLNLQQWNKPPR